MMSRRLPIPIAVLSVLAVAIALFTFWQGPEQTSRKSLLRDQDTRPFARLLAADELAADGTKAIPELLAALDDRNPETRSAGAFGLGRIGPDAMEVLPRVIDHLRDPVPAVRSGCVKALTAIQTDKPAAASSIAPLISDDDPEVRHTASQELSALGRFALPAVLKEFRTAANPEGRCEAIALLLKVGDGRFRTAEIIREALRDQSADDAVRDVALTALLQLDAATAEEVEAALFSPNLKLARQAVGVHWDVWDESRRVSNLIRLLDHTDQEMRRAAISILTWSIRDPGVAAPRLAELLKLASGSEATGIALLLLKIDGRSPEAISHLKAAACDLDAPDSWRGVWGLRNLAMEELREVIEKLAEAAERGPEERRRRALSALQRLGDKSRPAIESVIFALHDEDPSLRFEAARVIESMQSAAADAVPHLVRIIESQLRAGKRIDEPLISALGQIGPAAAPAVPLLVELAKSPAPGRGGKPSKIDPDVRNRSVVALGRIGANQPEVIALAMEAADRSQPFPEVLSMLPRVGVAPALAVPKLRVATFSTNEAVVRAACDALGEYGTHSAAAVPELILVLQDTNSASQQAAVIALTKIGPPAKDALPVLQTLLRPPRVESFGSPAVCELSPIEAAQRVLGEWNSHEWQEKRLEEIWKAIEAISPEAVSEWQRSSFARSTLKDP